MASASTANSQPNTARDSNEAARATAAIDRRAITTVAGCCRCAGAAPKAAAIAATIHAIDATHSALKPIAVSPGADRRSATARSKASEPQA